MPSSEFFYYMMDLCFIINQVSSAIPTDFIGPEISLYMFVDSIFKLNDESKTMEFVK